MIAGGPKNFSGRRPTVLLLLCSALIFSVLIFSSQSTFFSYKSTGVGSRFVLGGDGSAEEESDSVVNEDIEILSEFQSQVQECVVLLFVFISIFFILVFGSISFGVSKKTWSRLVFFSSGSEYVGSAYAM